MSGTETQGGRETMPAGENAQIVQRAYEAINSADMDTLTALFDESASWHTPRRSPVAGDNEGREAVLGLPPVSQTHGYAASRSRRT